MEGTTAHPAHEQDWRGGGCLGPRLSDTTLRYGQIELEPGRLGPFPDRLVATGYVVRPDGTGLYQITSGQLQLAKGADGVLQGSFTAELSPVGPADATAEVVADAAGQFVARRLTW